jgi:hypothetical protein
LPDRTQLDRAQVIPDEAVFTTARVGGSPRSWVPAATLALAIVALIASAILAQAPRQTDLPGTAAAASPTAALASAPTPARTARPLRTSRPAIDDPGPALLQVEARANGRYVFVNGDVFSMAAFKVVISLEAGDTVTATRTVNLPGGSTAFLTGANPRFQVQFEASAEPGAPWISATAYDAAGEVVAALHQAVLSPTVALATTGGR